MIQWEYKELPACNIDILTQLGEAGWELCGVDNHEYIFKRNIGPDWKARCEAAEAYIAESPCDPDITASQLKAYKKWQEIKNKQ